MPLVTLFFIWIPMIIMNALVPFWSHPGVFFGILIPKEHMRHPKLLAIRRNYCVATVIAAVLLMGLSILCVQREVMTMTASMVYLIPAYFVIHMLIYLQGYRGVKRLKKENQWMVEKPSVLAVDTSEHHWSTVSRMWNLIPFWLIAANIVFVAWNYDQIPANIPIHYNASGQVDRIAQKSIGIIFAPNLIQCLMALIMAGVQEALIRSKRQVHPEQSESINKIRRSSRRYQAAVIYFITLISLALFASVQFSIAGLIDSSLTNWILIAAILLIFAALISLPIVLKKNQALMAGANTHIVFPDAGSDEHWKWGLFYVNRDDPALFVEKRGGIGVTVNLGWLTGWFFLIAPLIFAGVIVLFSFL
ncbi:Uncharacterized membrane protein [Paenibacillus tianmuensis]|uniref:Uncharacterized membrane protein n=1 Tax=Paenibacillus tianmuensis TaxID=624147 RepID=A0A1G4TBM0_9BACL|nr:DUF1648 domain-containing protein [Paenibacillus tianmuensis]SCW78822.1 Uncharacterized membrane protein [Paenibacillus tianmuensis]